MWAAEKESLCSSTTVTNLKDLSTSQRFVNLLCQVVSKCFTPIGNCVVLSVWDGTLPACQSIHIEPISEQGKLTSEELIYKAAGRSVDVFLYDNHAEGDVRRVCPGDFVRITNVHMKAVDRGVDSTGKVKKDKYYPFKCSTRPCREDFCISAEILSKILSHFVII